MKQTSKARNHFARRRDFALSDVKSGRLLLTELQTRRFLGLSYLEGGKDPLMIIDALLDTDTQLRVEYKLSLADTKLVSEFLNGTVNSGWRKDELLDFITKIWNSGVQNLAPDVVRSLVTLIRELQECKWALTQFVHEITITHNISYVFKQYKQGMISAEEAKRRVLSNLES